MFVWIICLPLIFNSYSYFRYHVIRSFMVLSQRKHRWDSFFFHSSWNHIWTTHVHTFLLYFFIPCSSPGYDKTMMTPSWWYLECWSILLKESMQGNWATCCDLPSLATFIFDTYHLLVPCVLALSDLQPSMWPLFFYTRFSVQHLSQGVPWFCPTNPGFCWRRKIR